MLFNIDKLDEGSEFTIFSKIKDLYLNDIVIPYRFSKQQGDLLISSTKKNSLGGNEKTFFSDKVSEIYIVDQENKRKEVITEGCSLVGKFIDGTTFKYENIIHIDIIQGAKEANELHKNTI